MGGNQKVISPASRSFRLESAASPPLSTCRLPCSGDLAAPCCDTDRGCSWRRPSSLLFMPLGRFLRPNLSRITLTYCFIIKKYFTFFAVPLLVLPCCVLRRSWTIVLGFLKRDRNSICYDRNRASLRAAAAFVAECAGVVGKRDNYAPTQ